VHHHDRFFDPVGILKAWVVFAILLILAACRPLTSEAIFPHIRVLKNIAYGDDIKHSMDVYLSSMAKDAPVILMVHGGAWRTGDKTDRTVVDNKVSRWVKKGFVFVSINYRLLPHADPLTQVNDVAKALATAQKNAPRWGGDARRFILMGHSAGAHLVSVLAAAPAMAFDHGAVPWLGTVSIDTAALDVPSIMERDHHRFYDAAFGKNREYWGKVSPLHLLQNAGAPFLAICSSQRRDKPCAAADRFVEKAQGFGMQARVLRVDMSHRQANGLLGKDAVYTSAVETFLAGFDESIKQLLSK